jgi:hypothetical protein
VADYSVMHSCLAGARHRGVWFFEALPWCSPGWDDVKKNEKYCCLNYAMTQVMAIVKKASGSDVQVLKPWLGTRIAAAVIYLRAPTAIVIER